MGELIAGHEYDSWGHCTRKRTDGSDCPLSWRVIASADDCDLETVGWAHYGALKSTELEQIKKKRQAELDAIDRAMASVSGRS